MTTEQINAAVAERVGWEKTPVRMSVAGWGWVEKEARGDRLVHRANCFTTASAEWCELLEVVIVGEHVSFQPSDAFFRIEWNVEPRSFERVDGPDLYTAVALAYLKMTEE